MEQNSTQEPDASNTVSAHVVESGPVVSETPVVEAPVQAQEVGKTTIQVFKSTTHLLTADKHGNDTYDDVIRRYRKVIDSLKDQYPDIYKALAGQ